MVRRGKKETLRHKESWRKGTEEGERGLEGRCFVGSFQRPSIRPSFSILIFHCGRGKKKEEMRSESERGDEHKVANNSKSAASGAATAGRGRKLGVRL